MSKIIGYSFCGRCGFSKPVDQVCECRSEDAAKTAVNPPPFKLDLSHIPGFFIRALASPFMLGAAKYGRGSWRSEITTGKQAEEACNRRLGSLLNHLTAYMDGEFYDGEGPAHLSAVAWNALYILWLKVTWLAEVPVDKDILATKLAEYEAKKGGK